MRSVKYTTFLIIICSISHSLSQIDVILNHLENIKNSDLIEISTSIQVIPVHKCNIWFTRCSNNVFVLTIYKVNTNISVYKPLAGLSVGYVYNDNKFIYC